MQFRPGKIGFALPVHALVLCLLANISACSSNGSAPVYSRGSVTTSRQVNAPIRKQERKTIRFKSPRTYYLVQAGDTLYSIAWRHYLEHKQLAVWNGIKAPNYAIYPGQRLRLKPPEARRKKAISSNRVKHPVALTKKRQPAVEKKSPSVRIRPPKQSSSAKPMPAKRTAVTQPKKSVKLAWSWPTKGRVTRTFSSADQNRKGVWINGKEGQPIKAAEAGKVVYAGSGLVGYGNLVIIKHDQKFLSAYGYNRKLLVKEGDKLAKGDIVAYMGSPNRGGQPMLHFEIRKQGKPINPLPLLPKR